MLTKAKQRSADATERSAATIRGLLAEAAARSPHVMAILAPGRPALSYGRLLEQVRCVVEALRGLGVRRGDRVALVMPDGPEMAVAFLGVTAGATCAPLNPAYRAREFDFYLSDVAARVLIVLRGAQSPARQAAAARGISIIELAPHAGAEAGVFDLAGGAAGRASHDGPAQPEDVALVLHTSGTTSRPKLVPLTHANLYYSVGFQWRALGLTCQDRCLNVMPLFHIHALVNGLLGALGAGGSVVCTPGFEAPRFFQWMDECRPTWYTAAPTVHQAILDRAAANRDVIARRPLRLIRSASAPLPPSVIADLERTFNAPVLESYGLTETAAMVTCNPPPPRLRKPGTVGLPIGPQVAVTDEAGNRLPAGREGEVVVRGPSVIRGYENNPQANARFFMDGWLRTGDLGSFDADGYLTITGRIKEIINRAGEKIAPREVEEALLQHPAVAQAVVFAMPDERLGEDVAAAVVLRQGASAGERELQEHVAARLADFKVPRRIVLLGEIPKGPTGKLQRAGLAEKLGLTGTRGGRVGASAYVAPRTPLERTLAGIWCDVLGVEEVGVEDGFLELGGDSVLAARLIARARALTGVEVPMLGLFGEASTVATQAKLIASAGGNAQTAEGGANG